VDGDHGRIETRKYTLIHDVAWLARLAGACRRCDRSSTRETAGKTEQETRFYITSLNSLAATVGPMIRDHWAIENSLHWVLDMVSATTNAGCEPITHPPIPTI
jgi:predicted transposase YbfD/YdcC